MLASILGASFLLVASAIEPTMEAGNKLFAAKKYAEAIPEYRKVLDADPDHWAANYQIAMAWMAQFHPASADPADAEIKKEAQAALEKLMTLPAPSGEAVEKVEKYYLSLLTSAGDHAQAIAFLEKKLEQEPDDPDRMAMVAQLEAKRGNFAESLQWYRKLADLQPETKTHWYTVGVLCWERSNKAGMTIPPEERAEVIQQGIDALDQALVLDPEYLEAIAYKNLMFREKADLLSRAGKDEEAKAAFAESQRLREQAMELMEKKKVRPSGAVVQ